MRSLIGLMVALAVAAVSCSVEQLPVPSAPLRSPDPSVQAQPPAPETPFAGLPVAVEDRLLRTADDDWWLIGTLGDGWAPLGIGFRDAAVDDTWGRITATSLDADQLVVSTLAEDGGLRELYRNPDGADASAGASYTIDGAGLLVFNVSLGLRHVDLATGRYSEVFAPGAFFAGHTTTGNVRWSPNGRWLVYFVCDMSTCHSQIAEDLVPTAVVDDFVPLALAGGHLVGYRNEADRDALMVDLESGDRRPIAPDITSIYGAMALSESRFLVWGAAGEEGFGFVLVDREAGIDTLVTTDPVVRFPVGEFVDPNWAILKPAEDSTVWVEPGSRLALLDLVAGRIVEDVIAVPPAPPAP